MRKTIDAYAKQNLPDATLTVKGLSVRYNAAAAVCGNMVVGAWRVALLGANGACKSTMLKVIACLVRATGPLVVGGAILDSLPIREWLRGSIVYVPEKRPGVNGGSAHSAPR